MKAAVALSALALAACATSPAVPNAVQRKLDLLRGQTLGSAVAVLGQPRVAIQPGSGAGSVGTYAWSFTQTALTGRLEFVQTGERYVGSRQIGTEGGSHGIAATPIFEDLYEPTGHYQPESALVRVCEVTIRTNAMHVVTDVMVIGCG